MVEYANTEVVKLLKQYKMLSKSLNLTTDIRQKNDICGQMTKIIEYVIKETNSAYVEKYNKLLNQPVYLMDDEKNRLSELINLINERITYINNLTTTNKDITGLNTNVDRIFGEDKLDEYKNQVKIIDKYKNNIKLEHTLKKEINNLDISIKRSNIKISNHKNLNRKLEEQMIKLLDSSLTKLSLYELQNCEKEIDLAYTELGYSLEKAKENAKIARKDYSEEIALECDNMLATITSEYEKYKEKKLILKLINIFKNKVSNYEELLRKREEINNILLNIQESKLYSLVGLELNKEYATIKLEGEDLANIKNLIEERQKKAKQLEEVKEENSSDTFKTLLKGLLENERKYQEILEKEKQKQEELRKKQLKEIEKQKQIELAKRQKLLEEERKKEIEERTKQLLVEKKNPVLMKQKEEKTETSKKTIDNFKNDIFNPPKTKKTESPSKDLFIKKTPTKDDSIFSKKNINNTVVDKGIPVIKRDKLKNDVVSVQKKKEPDKKVFPEIPLDKKEDIFPSFPEITKENETSFFDDDEFKDLSNYMEDSPKKNWF